MATPPLPGGAGPDQQISGYAGKIALWCYRSPSGTSAPSPWPPAYRHGAGDWEAILNAAVQIYTRAPVDQWRSPSSPPPGPGDGLPVTIDGAAYRQQVFTVTPPPGWMTDGQCLPGSVCCPFRYPHWGRKQPGHHPDQGLQYRSRLQGHLQGALSRGQRGGPERQRAAYPPPMCASNTSCFTLCQGDGPVRQPPELPLRHRPQDQPAAAQRHLQLLDSGEPDELDDPDEPTPPGETASKSPIGHEAGTVTLAGATFEVVGPDGDTIGVYTTRSPVPSSPSLRWAITPSTVSRVSPAGRGAGRAGHREVRETAEVDFENEPYGDTPDRKIDGPPAPAWPGPGADQAHRERRHHTGTTDTGGSTPSRELKPGI